MRTWSKPAWVKDQETGAFQRGSANIRNYAGSGTRWLRLKWQSTFKVENETQRTSKFFLRDEKTRQEYILDKEEFMNWVRYV